MIQEIYRCGTRRINARGDDVRPDIGNLTSDIPAVVVETRSPVKRVEINPFWVDGSFDVFSIEVVHVYEVWLFEDRNNYRILKDAADFDTE